MRDRAALSCANTIKGRTITIAITLLAEGRSLTSSAGIARLIHHETTLLLEDLRCFDTVFLGLGLKVKVKDILTVFSSHLIKSLIIFRCIYYYYAKTKVENVSAIYFKTNIQIFFVLVYFVCHTPQFKMLVFAFQSEIWIPQNSNFTVFEDFCLPLSWKYRFSQNVNHATVQSKTSKYCKFHVDPTR